MSKFPYLPIWTDSFIADTQSMSLDEIAAYILLLVNCWRSPECKLPYDEKRISHMLRVPKSRARALCEAVSGHFEVHDGYWTHAALLDSRKKAEDLTRKRSSAANKRWGDNTLKNMQSDDAGAYPHADAKPPNSICTTPAYNSNLNPNDKEKEEEDAQGDFELLDQIRAAVGVTLQDAGPYWSDENLMVHVEAWRGFGLPDDQIVAQAKASRNRNPEPPDGPKALDRWMEAIGRAKTNPPKAKIGAPTVTPSVQASPQDRLKFYADWVNGEKPCPASAISTSLARDLLAAGLVTEARMRQKGVW